MPVPSGAERGHPLPVLARAPHIRGVIPALYSPLPEHAKVVRRPVVSPEVLASEHGAAVAGTDQIAAESSGPGWLRISMVVVDATGALLAVNDAVIRHGDGVSGDASGTRSVIESAGGSVQPDGSVRGTRWSSRVLEDGSAAAEEPAVEATPAALGDADVAGLRALAAELLKRGGRA